MRTISLLCLLSTVWLFPHSAAAGESGQYAGPAQSISPLYLVSTHMVNTPQNGQSIVPGDGFLLDDVYFPIQKDTIFPKSRMYLYDNRLPAANPDMISTLQGIIESIENRPPVENDPVAHQAANIMADIRKELADKRFVSYTPSSVNVDATFSKDEIEESRHLAVSFSAKYGIASASASMERARRDLAEKSVFYITIEEIGRGSVSTRDTGGLVFDDDSLRAIEAMPDSNVRARTFLTRYGSHYVSSVGYGFRLCIRVTAAKKEEENMRKLAASIKASGFGGSAKTSISEETRSLATKINCDYEIGFNGIAVPSTRFARMASLDEIFTLLEDLREQKIVILPAPISYTLESYYGVLAKYPKLQEIFTNNAVKTPIAAKAEYGLPIGTVLPYGGMEAPHGYLLCDGSLRDRREFDKLFEVLGNAYGPKKLSDIEYELTDNEKTAYKGREADLPYLFRLPDLRGRFMNGADSGSGNLGSFGGEVEHTLTVDEMPTHRHEYLDVFLSTQTAPNYPPPNSATTQFPTLPTIKVPVNIGVDGKIDWDGHNRGIQTIRTDGMKEVGESKSHNNLPPYVTVNYIIKY